MKANPDKFQAVAVGSKTYKKAPVFKVGNVNIEKEDVVKLLGVDIDFNLKFDCHIQNICKKAGQQLNVLRRIGKNLCKLSRMTIFHTFILSNFNFYPLSWHFCSKTSTNKIEKIQERALRFVYDDFNSSYTELLTKANLPTLETRRIRTMAIETFKILNGLAPPVLSDLLIKRENKYNFRYSNILQVPHHFDMRRLCCGTLCQMNLGKPLILIGSNLLFLIGMDKIVNVQHAMLYFKFLTPQHMAAYESFLCGFVCNFIFVALFVFLFSVVVLSALNVCNCPVLQILLHVCATNR